MGDEERPERGSLVLESEHTIEDEELWEDDGSEDYLGWYCIRTDPFPCPAAGCTFVAGHMTAAHLVLVWEERDDPNLSGTPSGRWRSAAIRASSGTSNRSGRAPRTTPGRRPADRSTACAAAVDTSVI